jgi:predicted nucleic acid-binding protein
MLFGEAPAERVAAQLQGARLIAPQLIDYELANVCLFKIRRDPPRRAELLRGFALRVTIKIEHQPVDPAGVLALAEATGLTAYDACYLWLARTHGAGLVTLDKQLAAAFAD